MNVPRPTIDEHDAYSYLEPSLAAHAVLGGDEAAGLQLDGEACFDFEELNLAPDLCRQHAFELARAVGFEGPATLPVSYQEWLPCEPEEVMIRRVDGRIVQIASYSYGRAYFEPGEPRTAPCAVCGVETLVDTLAGETG